MILPEDCPYVDYSVLDVKKAAKKLNQYSKESLIEILKELEKVNEELAKHLRDHLNLEEIS